MFATFTDVPFLAAVIFSSTAVSPSDDNFVRTNALNLSFTLSNVSGKSKDIVTLFAPIVS